MLEIQYEKEKAAYDAAEFAYKAKRSRSASRPRARGEDRSKPSSSGSGAWGWSGPQNTFGTHVVEVIDTDIDMHEVFMINATGPPKSLGPQKDMDIDATAKRTAQDKDLE